MLRVRRSLTIKQMAMVSGVAVVTLCIFIAIQLFHFVQQRKEDYAQQLETIASSVKKPLGQSILDADWVRTQHVLNTLQSVGILERASVILPNELPTLYTHLPSGKPVPQWVLTGFNLPLKISIPIYSSTANQQSPKPLAYLVLQADPYRMYQFIISALSTMLTTYLLLALILSISISWCINRLIVHPLRAIARELEALPENELNYHQLPVLARHEDDELGMLIRSYNRNQQWFEKKQAQLQDSNFVYSSIPNEELFLASLTQRLSQEKPFHVMLIGIESLGDSANVTCPLIEAIRSVLPAHCLLARLSYNEFALLASDIERPFMAMKLAREIMAQINAPKLVDQPLTLLHPTGSIGMVRCDAQSDLTAIALVSQARAAKLSAYQQGKNQILLFEPDMTEIIQRRLRQENDVLHIIMENDFALFLQPQLHLESGQVVGVEALLRHKMPDGSFGLERDFIVLAEQMGVMVQLGYKVLELGCRILAGWQAQGISLPLSVNVSGMQLQQSNFLPELRNLLSRYKIDLGQLVLEITETAKITDLDYAFSLLTELRTLGISIELDDFGLGFSGLEYLNRLRNLPIDVIKIGRPFVAVLPQDEMMVNIITSIAHTMNIQLVAEGIETPEQRDWLVNHGVIYGQGYLFSPPLPVEEFENKYLADIVMQ